MASAQNQNNVLTVEPPQLNVTGVRGSATMRQLVVTSSAPIVNPQSIPLDLLRTDGAKVLPAINIHTEIASQSKPNEATARVNFDLRNFWGVSSGEFTWQVASEL